MRMQIEQVDLASTATRRACHEIYLAALRADQAEGPLLSAGRFDSWLTTGWIGNPSEAWLARTETDPDPDATMSSGAIAGWYRLELPDRENLDRARLELMVHPDRRRRGLGRGLLRHAAARAAAHGRTMLESAAQNGSAGESFARAMGAQAGIIDVQRTLELAELGAGRLAELRGQAERAAAGYSLVSWTGPVPDEFLGPAAALFTALSDAPHNPGTAPETWDAQRVSDRINDPVPRFGTRQYSLGARHDASGELAALTQVTVDLADPGWGHQQITAVIGKHRGHRLGLLVKTAMLDLLASAEPQLERISTWNAEVNQHMIAVNQLIGYTVLGPPNTDWQFDVPAVPVPGPRPGPRPGPG
jgi:GNAT superfamily N-acetyltransferase